MTSHHRRDNDRSVFTAKTPHFFKIILDDTFRDGKLVIPKTFVRKYGNDLPNPILLKVPSGAVWQVELTKCDGDVWLQNGWQEFAKYYSLAYGHFLVFRYEQNSQFSVVIFDKSTSEIEYPYAITHGEESPDSDGEFQEPEMDEIEDDISIEILDRILPCPKRSEKSPLPCPRPHKSMRTNSTFKRNIDSQCSTQELGGGLNYPATKGGEGKSTGRRGSQSKILGRMQPLTASEKASAFKSDNPFFMITMQPSYIKSRPSIPTAFARKFLIMKQGYVILYLSDGRTWSVKYLRGASNSKPNAKFSDGWKAFTQDNHLKVGDVCVFELKKGTEISLKVVFFRLVEDANCHLSPADENGANQVEPNNEDCVYGISSSLDQFINEEFQLPQGQKVQHSNLKQLIHEESTGRQCTQRPSCSRIPGALEAASKFISEYPFFKRVVGPNNLEHCNVSVPFRFIEKLIKKIEEQIMTLQVADRSWPVKLIIYPSHKQGKLCKGWAAFSRENSLRQGDVCVFELIKKDDAVLKVSIFRHFTTDDISPCPKPMKKSPSPYLHSREKRETNPSGNSERISKTQTLPPLCSPASIQSIVLKLQKSKRNLNLHNSTRQFGVKEEGGGGMSTVQKCPKSKVLGRMLPLTPKEKARALQRASAFKSENPFFVVAMQPSYIHSRCKLNMPIKVIEKLVKQIDEQIVTLKVADSSWLVKLIFYPLYHQARLSTGWSAFARENSLRVGDACVFELINRDDAVLKVSIFRFAG